MYRWTAVPVALLIAGQAGADLTGCVVIDIGDGVYRLYAQFDDPADTAMAVMNSNIGNGAGWVHDDVVSGRDPEMTWIPVEGSTAMDSFVTLDGEPGYDNETQLDGNFDNYNPDATTLGVDAGWFNPNPASGVAGTDGLVLLAQFAHQNVQVSTAGTFEIEYLPSGKGEPVIEPASFTTVGAPIVTGPIVNACNGHAYYLTDFATWESCALAGPPIGGDLVTINDAGENRWILETFSGQLGEFDSALYHGYNDVVTEGVFEWISGAPVGFENWARGEPNNLGNEDFGGMWTSPDGEWNDFPDFIEHRGVIEVVPAAPSVIGGPITNPANGNTYYLLDASTWHAAARGAVVLGGQLATVNSADENEWIFQTFGDIGGTTRNLWIGLNDTIAEGDHRWLSDQPVTYTNWERGEPNNGGEYYETEEDGVHIWASYYFPGTWNDQPVDTVSQGGITFHGVVEVQCIRDLTGDGEVDGFDLGLLLGNWGNAGLGDFNCDGMVDGADLGMLLADWGTCPFGGCCFGYYPGYCEDVTEAECDYIGGTFNPDEPCADNPCGILPKPCCFNGGCTQISLEACLDMMGTPVEDCAECFAGPMGACCIYYSQQCFESTQIACSESWIEGATCAENPCGFPAPCCFGDGSCMILDQYQCDGYNGRFVADCADCMPACGQPDAGDCCEANGTPGCDDATCCEIVCGYDPFCCASWDVACAGLANDMCGVCQDPGVCGPGNGDCCEANGTPGCDDKTCCEIVCDADPFCCDMAWDGICADQADALCGCAPGFPDDCADAIAIGDGTFAFTTDGANDRRAAAADRMRGGLRARLRQRRVVPVHGIMHGNGNRLDLRHRRLRHAAGGVRLTVRRSARRL